MPTNRQRLTRHEEMFVQLLVADPDMSAVDAYLRAYPRCKNRGVARRSAYKVKHRPRVAAAIQAARREVAIATAWTLERHMEDLRIIRDAAKQDGDYSSALGAEELRGKAMGVYKGKGDAPAISIVPIVQIVVEQIPGGEGGSGVTITGAG
jgi:hypothetical protein